MTITGGVQHGTRLQPKRRDHRLAPARVRWSVATVAATFLVGLAAGCSSNDTISCTATLGEASSEATFDNKGGTKFETTLNGYTIAYEVTNGGSGLQVELRNPDQSSISTAKITTAGGGSAATPDGELAFQCDR